MHFRAGLLKTLWVFAGCALLATNVFALEPRTILFDNVRVFDGKSVALSEPTNVLVRGNTIERISSSPIITDRRADTLIINGNGRTLMPGLIDVHWHAMMAAIPMQRAMTSDPGYVHIAAAREA